MLASERKDARIRLKVALMTRNGGRGRLADAEAEIRRHETDLVRTFMSAPDASTCAARLSARLGTAVVEDDLVSACRGPTMDILFNSHYITLTRKALDHLLPPEAVLRAAENIAVLFPDPSDAQAQPLVALMAAA